MYADVSDNELCLVSVLTSLAIVPAVLAAPFFVWWARRKNHGRRLAIAHALLVIGMATILWLDAVVVVLAWGIMDGSPLAWHMRAAGFFAVLWLLVVPLGPGRRIKDWLGASSFFAFALSISFVPWNEHKRCALDVDSVVGQPIETVQAVMGEYEATLRSPRGDIHARLRDVDPASLSPTRIEFSPFGGTYLEIRDGCVGEIFFVYD